MAILIFNILREEICIKYMIPVIILYDLAFIYKIVLCESYNSSDIFLSTVTH